MMAQHGARSAGEDGSHPTPVHREEPMADRVDAAVDAPEPAHFEAMVDRPASKTKL